MLAMQNYETLEITTANGITGIWLNRPDVRNAFNAAVIADLTSAFNSIDSKTCRVALLGGRGKVFCAGADLHWMRDMAGFSEKQNLADALALAEMLEAVDSCTVPVLARVQRAAFGGALGLLACCDSVICELDTLFAFSEVRLGISPATISPYVINKIGASYARDLFFSGETFSAERALQAGLVHQAVPAERLDEAVDRKLGSLLKAGPQAAMATKKLVRSLTTSVNGELRRSTAALIARLRVSPEGQEGLGAFLEKRQASWISESPEY